MTAGQASIFPQGEDVWESLREAGLTDKQILELLLDLNMDPTSKSCHEKLTEAGLPDSQIEALRQDPLRPLLFRVSTDRNNLMDVLRNREQVSFNSAMLPMASSALDSRHLRRAITNREHKEHCVKSSAAGEHRVDYSASGSSGNLRSSSSFGSTGSGGGCFIATAAYGTAFEDELRALYEFRDSVLLKKSCGRKLVAVYYRISPPVARFIGTHTWSRAFIRAMLRPVIWIAKRWGQLP